MLAEDELGAEVAAVLGERPTAVVILAHGRNNVVARVTVGGGFRVVKRYFRHEADPRDRLGTEFALLRFLWNNGLHCIPEPVAMDADAGIGVYSHVPGEPVAASGASLADGLSLAHLLTRMSDLRDRPEADDLPDASEAAFTLASYMRLLEQRLERLRAAGAVPAGFLEEELIPVVGDVLRRVERRHSELGTTLDDAGTGRTLSPGDIGFHNALRLADGSLAFVDFEYGGWDEPANVIASACLPPGVPLPQRHHARVLDRLIGAIGGGRELATRVRLVYPLLAVKWSLILLNEFLDVDRRRRAFAAALPDNFEAAQIAKSRKQLRIALESADTGSFLDELASRHG